MYLIAYFTFTGNNKKVAETLKNMFNATIFEIKDRCKRNFLRDSFFAIIKKDVKIDPLNVDPRDFDSVIICTPIWASNIPAAVFTFLKQNRDILSHKSLYFVSVSGYGDKNSKITGRITKYLKLNIKKALFLRDDEIKENTYLEKLEDFVKELQKELP
ncbi:MAG: flavodoxin domain-containing protein [candidate division WOR-3 bacterium]